MTDHRFDEIAEGLNAIAQAIRDTSQPLTDLATALAILGQNTPAPATPESKLVAVRHINDEERRRP